MDPANLVASVLFNAAVHVDLASRMHNTSDVAMVAAATAHTPACGHCTNVYSWCVIGFALVKVLLAWMLFECRQCQRDFQDSGAAAQRVRMIKTAQKKSKKN